MKNFLWYWNILSLNEKIKFLALLISRLALVGFDLLGLVLVSESVKLVTGEEDGGYKGLLSPWISSSQTNPYALTALAAILFFILKTVIAIQLSNGSVRFGSEIETLKTKILFSGTFFSRTSKRKLSDSDVLHLLNRSAHAAFAQTPILYLTIVSEGFLVIAIGLYLMLLDFVLFIGCAVFLSILALAIHLLINVKAQIANAKSINAALTAQQITLDTLANTKMLKVLGKHRFISELFDKSRSIQSSEMGRVVSYGYLPRFITELAVILGLGFFLAQRAFFSEATVAPSTLAVFLAAAFRAIASMMPFQNALSSLKIVSKDGELAIKEYDRGTSNYLGLPDSTKNLQPAIRFQDVTFRYAPELEPVISNATFEVGFGDYVQISGVSGAGKSTLVDLILNLIQPNSGAITYKSQSSGRDLSPNEVKFGYVPQVNSLIHGTLRQNLSLLDPKIEYHDEHLIETLRLCRLDDLVKSLPDGLETEFGSAGTKLSGGQVQRIALARALLVHPEILVLDEATNSLDSVTESEILETLKGLKGKITIIVITHGQTLAEKADYTLEVRGATVKVTHLK